MKLLLPSLDEDSDEVMVVETRPASVRELNRATHARLDSDPLNLQGAIDAYLEKREWFPECQVVRIREQECLGCGAKHAWCDGWFLRERHARDKTAFRDTKGKPLTPMEVRVERQDCGTVDVCSYCAECQLLLEAVRR